MIRSFCRYLAFRGNKAREHVWKGDKRRQRELGRMKGKGLLVKAVSGGVVHNLDTGKFHHLSQANDILFRKKEAPKDCTMRLYVYDIIPTLMIL